MLRNWETPEGEGELGRETPEGVGETVMFPC
jgi:hypothetical protein